MISLICRKNENVNWCRVLSISMKTKTWFNKRLSTLVILIRLNMSLNVLMGRNIENDWDINYRYSDWDVNISASMSTTMNCDNHQRRRSFEMLHIQLPSEASRFYSRWLSHRRRLETRYGRGCLVDDRRAAVELTVVTCREFFLRTLAGRIVGKCSSHTCAKRKQWCWTTPMHKWTTSLSSSLSM